jgi:hypothetical protein
MELFCMDLGDARASREGKDPSGAPRTIGAIVASAEASAYDPGAEPGFWAPGNTVGTFHRGQTS